jgi:AcrR family transcriptional regulator
MADATSTTASPEPGGDALTRRQQRRLLRQDVSRTQLLDAAEEVFGQRGFHDTTLKAIAELAEFSVGSVYSFFESKEDLFLSVLVRRGEEFIPGMGDAVASGPTPTRQLHGLVDFEVGFFRSHPHFGRLYLRSASLTLPVLEVPASAKLSENFDTAMELHADVFRRGQRTGEFRSGDPYVLARMLTGLVSAYQSLDPAVVSNGPGGGERLPLAALHDMVDGAFGRGS